MPIMHNSHADVMLSGIYVERKKKNLCGVSAPKFPVTGGLRALGWIHFGCGHNGQSCIMGRKIITHTGKKQIHMLIDMLECGR